MDDARYAGALNTWIKMASTANGGNPNGTISENGSPFNTPATSQQVSAFVATYVSNGTATTPSTGTTPSAEHLFALKTTGTNVTANDSSYALAA
jgi:hypothetical protein